MAARDLGVKHIRGHGLLDDDMSVSYDASSQAFYNVDSLADFLLSIGMRPIFELSFMPSWLVDPREQQIGGSGGSLEPPGPLLDPPGPHFLRTSIDTVWIACSERLPTRLNPLAEGACFSQATARPSSRAPAATTGTRAASHNRWP